MPHLVEMGGRYPGKVTVIAVHVEIPLDAEEGLDKVRDKVHAIVQRAKLPGISYMLREPQEVWQAKFEIEGYPSTFVFNKAGRIAKKFLDSEAAEAELPTLLSKLVQEP
ncbi:MAG: TlpA family protein disulfide reductase [Planctomycetota bacterium]|nr:hypothetical protein [Planctomycetota bacterium]